MSKRRLPHRFAPGLFALLTSGLMSLLVSGVATWKALSFVPDFASRWMVAWGNAWPIAFATLLVIAPFVRRLVAMLVEPPPAVPDVRARARNGA